MNDPERPEVPTDEYREWALEALTSVLAREQAKLDKFESLFPVLIDEFAIAARRRRSTHRGSNSEHVIELLAAEPDRVWTAQEVAEVLGTSVDTARTTLNRLDKHQVTKPSRGRFRYRPSEDDAGGNDD